MCLECVQLSFYLFYTVLSNLKNLCAFVDKIRLQDSLEESILTTGRVHFIPRVSRLMYYVGNYCCTGCEQFLL